MTHPTAACDGIRRSSTGCRALTSAGTRAAAALAVVAVLAGSACTRAPAGDPAIASTARAGTPSAGPTSHDYRPGLQAFPHLPEGVTQAPVVVMIPGGGFASADPSGLEPLADALAAGGAVAVPVRIRAEQDGVVHPVPEQDVLCALADGVATATAAGIRPTRLVLLGHSSGAHLSSLVTLTPEAFTPTCQDPVVRPDALVGLAGPYDIRDFADAADRLFAPGTGDATRDAANPVLLAARRPDVPVLLLHGAEDELVGPQFSEDFAAALRAGGHPTTLTVLPGVNHGEVYGAPVAAEPVLRWLATV